MSPARAVLLELNMKLIIAILLTACATTAPVPPKGGPRGLRASEHMTAAAEHDELARQRASWPDRFGSEGQPYVAWTRSWDTGVEDERLAAIHRSQAAALHAAYDDACGARPLDEVSISPIVRFANGGWNTTTGAILYLDASAGSPERLLADLKCHRAWMMLAPVGTMDNCPLDLPGIVVDARGDSEGITLSIVVRDPKLVGELQRRVAHDLESHGHMEPR